MIDFPESKNIQFVAGDDFSQQIYLGVPTSGYIFNSYMRIDGLTTLPFVCNNVDPLHGTVLVELPRATTSGIAPNVYTWTFQYTTLGGFKQTLYDGLATVIAPV